MNKGVKGYVLIILTVLSFAVSYFVVDYVFRNYPEITVENVIFWGLLGAVLSGVPFFLRTGHQRKIFVTEFKNFKKLILLSGILTTFGSFLWFWSLAHSSGGIVALLVQTGIIFTFLLGIIFLKEKINFGEILGFILVITGVIVISNLEGEVTFLAVLASIVSAFLYALQSFFIKKWGGKSLKSTVFAFQRILVTLIFLSILLFLQGNIKWIGFDLFFIIAVSQIFGFFIGRIFYVEAHKYLDISKLNVFLALEPVAVLVGAYFIFGDIIYWQKFLGAFLIIGGLIWFIKSQKQ